MNTIFKIHSNIFKKQYSTASPGVKVNLKIDYRFCLPLHRKYTSSDDDVYSDKHFGLAVTYLMRLLSSVMIKRADNFVYQLHLRRLSISQSASLCLLWFFKIFGSFRFNRSKSFKVFYWFSCAVIQQRISYYFS